MVKNPLLQGFKPDSVVNQLPDFVRVYVVGGAVRDAFMGRPCVDKDWVAVGATVNDMVKAGFTPVGADFPVFLHPITKEEYALARTERKSGHGYKGFTFHANPSVTLEQDLARRDFTINAMAISAQGELIDPYGGLSDLTNKRMRHVGSAFVEDPLRVLRLARFLARFPDFFVADETMALCFALCKSGELRHLVPERVFTEINKGMGEVKPSRMIQFITELNAWPELGGESASKFDSFQGEALEIIDGLTVALDRWVFQLAFLDSRDKLNQLCQIWRISNEIQQTATVYLALNTFMRAGKFDAPDFGRLLDAVDLYRKPSRLANVCKLLKHTQGYAVQLGLVDAAVEQVLSGQYKSWIAKAIASAGGHDEVPRVVALARQSWLVSIHQAILS